MTHLSSAGDSATFLSIAINDSPRLRKRGLRETGTVRQLRSMSSMKMHAMPGVWHRFLSADEAGADSPQLQAALGSANRPLAPSQWQQVSYQKRRTDREVRETSAVGPEAAGRPRLSNFPE